MDVNGLLLKRVPHSSKIGGCETYQVGIHMVYMRPKVREFLHFVTTRFRCAIWSSVARHNLMSLLQILFKESSLSKDSFCFIYDQSKCLAIPYSHPDKPHVKLLTKLISSIEVPLDIYNTLLIDDTPEKALFNMTGTCISPPPYDASSDYDMLVSKLIPYLTTLYYSRISVLHEFVIQNPFV